MMSIRSQVLEALKNVLDPEMGVNIVDLGLVYGVDIDDRTGHAHIDLTLTSPGCPLGPEIIRNIKRELQDLDGIIGVDVDLVWRPLWHPSMMSDDAKDELGYDEELGLSYSFS
jgi:metal-sulfur cluster biosynthetic enzyme